VPVEYLLGCVQNTIGLRGIGFWKHQVGVALSDRGHPHVDAPTFCDYLDLIELHFNSNEVNQVVIYEPPSSDECIDKLHAAGELLNLKGNVGMTARAKQHLLALLLNVASGSLFLGEIVSYDGATVSQAITFCDSLIDDAAGDHEQAKDICEVINKGEMVPRNVIPLDTDNIPYSPTRDTGETPAVFSLSQNHPNPFNPTTRIAFSLDREEPVSLVIYDIYGKVVKRLVDQPMVAGAYSEEWNGQDSQGNSVASGIYFYRLTAGNRTLTKKMVLLK
jgi:hypothetical protein